MTSAVVREWHAEDGWGVLDSAETPGGCWGSFMHVDTSGYKTLNAGQRVELDFESPGQDGYPFRATRIVPMGD